MSARETPIQKTKRVYGSKEKLVETVVNALDGLGAGDDDSSERLSGSSNSKLIRLAEVAAAVKERYGSKAKLVAAVAAAEGKAKDADYTGKLDELPIPRLLDLAKAAERRAAKKSATKKSAA